MVDMMTAMERVANTPIPRSYSIHLKQCVTLYLFVLPFTLVKDLGWGMIPVVTMVAFTLMGIEGIADEIEMPFGRYLNLHVRRSTHSSHRFGQDRPAAWYVTTVSTLTTRYRPSAERYCADLKEEIEYVCHSQRPVLTDNHPSRYIVERLPEGGEGMYGTDDGQGDD